MAQSGQVVKTQILPFAVMPAGAEGTNDLFIGGPAKLDTGGIKQNLETLATTEEKAALV